MVGQILRLEALGGFPRPRISRQVSRQEARRGDQLPQPGTLSFRTRQR